MTSMERIGCLMQGKLPDRVPIFCNMLEQGAKELGLSIKSYYESPDQVSTGQIKMRKRYGYDCVWGFYSVAHLAAALGCRSIIYSDYGPPNIGHMLIKTWDEAARFEAPRDLSGTVWDNTLQVIRNLKEAVGGTVPVLSCTLSSFSLPAILMGTEKWFEMLYTAPPDLVEHFLKECSAASVLLTRTLFEAGADLVAYTSSLATENLIDKSTFEKTAMPWIKKDYAAVNHPALVYFNGGGRINYSLETLSGVVPISAYYLHPDDDIAEARRLTGGKAIICGTINDISLIHNNPMEIRASVQRIMAAGSPGGGFVFGTLLMPYLIPEENIRVMIEAAAVYGAYHTEVPGV